MEQMLDKMYFRLYYIKQFIGLNFNALKRNGLKQYIKQKGKEEGMQKWIQQITEP